MLRMDFVPLRDSREFRLLFTSRSITLFGTNAGGVALLVQAKQLTGSAVAVGLLGIAELVPIVVFGLYGGLLADRFDRGRMLRWCEAGLGCLAGALVLNASLPHPAIWPLYALAAGMSALAALQRPSFDAAVPRTVARERLSGASAMLSMSSNAGQIIGAAVGGAVAAGAGPAVRLPAGRRDVRGLVLAAVPAPTAGPPGRRRAHARPRAAQRGVRAALRP